MEITTSLKKRFVKDMDLAIKIFKEPYFESRLRLFQNYNQAYDEYLQFVKMLESFSNEQEYFAMVDSVTNAVVEAISSTEAYKKFNSGNMPEIKRVEGYDLGKNLYSELFLNKEMVSFDMKKANFQALKFFDKSIVLNCETYDELLRQFTDNEYFIKSKNIRQVLFGDTRLNPKRQVTIQKTIMNLVLAVVEDLNLINKGDFVLILNDEIVIEKKADIPIETYSLVVENVMKKYQVMLGVELFELKKVSNSSIYIKEDLSSGEIEFKCASNFEMPFLLRKLYGEEIVEYDKIFYHEGYLAKFLDTPEYEF